jgi:exopolysaccharide biosynthesis polyprenyl glycosylphosphotransferase
MAPAFHEGQKKSPQSVKSGYVCPTFQTQKSRPRPLTNACQSVISLLLPSPLRTRPSRNWLRLVTADFAFVSVSCLLLGAVRSRLGYARDVGTPLNLLGISLLHASLITLVGFSAGLYTAGENLAHQGRTLGKSVFWATGLLALAYSMQGASADLVALVFAAGVVDFVALFIWRWEDLSRERRLGQSVRRLRNVLIIGAGEVGRTVAGHLERHPEEGRTLCGFLDDKRPLGNGIIGRVSNLAHLARTGFIDEVLLATPHDRKQTLRVLHEACQLRLDVGMVADLFGCKAERTEIERIGELSLICLHEERLPAGLLAKRALDIVVASGALFMLAPVFAMIAVLIKLDSGGPMFYVAARAGRKGRLFRCYKFRTMVSNANEMKKSLLGQNQRSGPIFKIVDDPRITRVGGLLRRYSLDELPQLWNVVRGEMSLVGPRPHPLDDYTSYEIQHLARLDVTPGITGLWQVMARRDSSFEKGFELDREYISSWSLGSDARILWKTVKAVVQGSGD